MVELEYLSNPKILARAGIVTEIVTPEKRQTVRQFFFFGKERSVVVTPRTVEKVKNYYAKKDNLVLYLRAWADMLQEQGRDDVALPSGKSVEQVRAQQNSAKV